MSFLKKIFGFSIDDDSQKREAYRVEIAQLRAKVAEKAVSFGVRDLSATGIALNSSSPELKRDMVIKLNLFKGKTMMLQDLNVQIVRTEDGFVGGQFLELTTRQSDILHKITLDEQKRLLDLQKKYGTA